MQWVLIIAVVVVAGCEPKLGDPLRTLDVEVTGDLARVDNLRATVVWSLADPFATKTPFFLDDDDGVSGGAAVLTVHEPIDSGLLTDRGSGLVTASGAVLLYDDRDGDDELDVTLATADELRDRVVGWSPGFRLLYERVPNQPGTLRASIFRIDDADDSGREVEVPVGEGDTLPAQVFASADAACFGMESIPLRYPPQLSQEITALSPRPARSFPYGVNAEACPGGVLPDDWWGIECDADGNYFVQTLQFPTSESIGQMCGWLRRFCTLEAPTPLPREFPPCE